MCPVETSLDRFLPLIFSLELIQLYSPCGASQHAQGNALLF